MGLDFKRQVTAFVGMKAWSATVKSVRFSISTTSLGTYTASYQIPGQPVTLCGVWPTQGAAIDRLNEEAMALGVVASQEAPVSKGLTYWYWRVPTGKYIGQWRWHCTAANNRIIASGETYHNKQDMLDTIALLMGSSKATIQEKKKNHARKIAK